MENTGRRKPRNVTQTSSQMIFNTEDSSASRTISNATENLCSEVRLNATVLTGVCDAPYQTGLPEAASDSSFNSVKVEAFSNNQNHIQNKECVQLKELQDPFEKSEKLSSIIYEATRPCPEKIEDKMASTGCRNQVENKMYVDRYDKKLNDPLAAEPENGLLDSVGKPSEELLCSNAEVTSARLQESVPNTDVSVGNGLNQPEYQQNFPGIPPDSKFSKDGGKPASSDAAQNHAELSSLFDNIVDLEAGKIMSKCNRNRWTFGESRGSQTRESARSFGHQGVPYRSTDCNCSRKRDLRKN